MNAEIAKATKGLKFVYIHMYIIMYIHIYNSHYREYQFSGNLT